MNAARNPSQSRLLEQDASAVSNPLPLCRCWGAVGSASGADAVRSPHQCARQGTQRHLARDVAADGRHVQR